MGELLNQNPNGVLVVRDELVGFLRGLDRQGHEADRAFYLEAWSGAGSYTYDRIGRGTLHIPALTVSIIGGMTPGKLASYVQGAVGGGIEDDGLLQRFQVAVWPDLSGDWQNVDRYPNTSAKNATYDIFKSLDGINPADVGAVAEDGEIPALRFAPEAQELFDEFRSTLERRIRTSDASPAFESHLAKYRSLLPSLALIFHLVEVVQGQANGPVSLDAARLAADWCGYLETHARRIYASELYPHLGAAHRLVEKIKSGDIEDGMNVRDIYRPAWSGLADSQTVRAGIEQLVEHNFVRVEHISTGGRTADVIRVNPALIGGRAA